jgi:ribonucleoside-triphosphate reductase
MCRTANGLDINGFGQLKDGRGNICPVTIIMPTLAMKVKLQVDALDLETEEAKKAERITRFMKVLTKKIAEAKDTLIERFNYIASQSSNAAKFMWDNNTMAGYVPEEGVISALKHGTLAIGQLGLAETLQILIGNDHTSEEGMNIAKDIEGLFKEKAAEYKEEYKLNFGVYYTPKRFSWAA